MVQNKIPLHIVVVVVVAIERKIVLEQLVMLFGLKATITEKTTKEE
jgi:hypothetical protein